MSESITKIKFEDISPDIREYFHMSLDSAGNFRETYPSLSIGDRTGFKNLDVNILSIKNPKFSALRWCIYHREPVYFIDNDTINIEVLRMSKKMILTMK
jgi:hypothetical protein